MKITKAITIMILTMASIIITSCHGKKPKDIDLSGLSKRQQVNVLWDEFKKYEIMPEEHNYHEGGRAYTKLKNHDRVALIIRAYNVSVTVDGVNNDKFIPDLQREVNQLKAAYKKKCAQRFTPCAFLHRTRYAIAHRRKKKD